MEKKLSVKDYELLYRNALSARDRAHITVPAFIERLDDCKQICRVCGCQNDGSFIDIDTFCDFEFEPSICSYRALFQRTSLQFQFSTMPDLPTCICAICGYKVKTFFLLTRQFVINQHSMRSAISDWYRNRYGIEAPEQIEDRNQLLKQLAEAKAYDPSFKMLPTKSASKPMKPVKELIKDCGIKRRPKLQRSKSDDSRAPHRVGRAKNHAYDATNMRLISNGYHTSRSTLNIRLQEQTGPVKDSVICHPVKRTPMINSHKAAVPHGPRLERNVPPNEFSNLAYPIAPRLMQSDTNDSEMTIIVQERPQKMAVVPQSKAQMHKSTNEKVLIWR